MVVVPFLRNNPSAVMFFQRFIFPAKTFRNKKKQRKKKLRTAIEWDYGILPPSSIKGLPTDKNVQGSRRDHLTKGAIFFSFHVTDFIKQ
jgi:hypothetical protein